MTFSRPPHGWDVVGLGANSVDTVHLLPTHPRPHGALAKVRIQGQVVCCGGQTATAMATCARLGLRAAYVGTMGTDDRGRRIADALAQHGVDTTTAVVRDVPNQYAVILIDGGTGERIVLWERDERLALATADLPFEAIAAARVLHVDDVDQPAALEAARFARARGVPVTSDLDRMTDRTEELVQAVSIPIFAEHLTAELTGLDDQERALRKLRRIHDGPLVVTLGADGAIALEHDRMLRVPGFRVDVVDTTGAGDVFRGAFIYGLLREWPLEQCLRFSNAAAAIGCTRLGAMNGAPALEEIHTLL